MIEVRPFQDDDWPALWRVLEPVFRAGETYPYPPDLSAQEARRLWIDVPQTTYLAVEPAGHIIGSYYLKPNQPELGAHVCNCGYVVDQQARGRGVASRLCAHSLDAARSMGYRAMQFNLVVSTNEAAVRLWKRHGFELVGTLPGAFQHPRLGDVDAYVMYQRLLA